MLRIPIYAVDSFSSEPFSGNPAAVCIYPTENLPADVKFGDALMQKIAAEQNLSETAFIQGANAATDSEFDLRWFTPTQEVDLCGHATLATAAVLAHRLSNPHQKLSFRTKTGLLTAQISSDGLITLGLPVADLGPVPEELEVDAILKVMGIRRDDIEELSHSASTRKLLICFNSNWDRSRLEGFPQPNSQALLSTHDGRLVRGVIITLKYNHQSVEEQSYDFISRYFAPWNGIPEDPVTGAAHTVLVKYWSTKLKKMNLKARQCSSRGGDLTLSLSHDQTRVEIGGYAYIVSDSHLNITTDYLKSICCK